MTELEKLLKQTEQLWKQYVLGNDVEIVEGIREIFSPDCVIIGTGRHEVYMNRDQFVDAVVREVREHDDIHFQFRDFWCEGMYVTPEVIQVFGGLYIWWESEDQHVYINMASRFSIKKWSKSGKSYTFTNPRQTQSKLTANTIRSHWRSKLENLRKR